MFRTIFCLFLAFCCSPTHLTNTVSSGIFQMPSAITLLQVNSTAEFRCAATDDEPFGLYLKRRYALKRELLYMSLPNCKKTLHATVEHRLSITGTCCNFILRLSQLQPQDTDGYICEWLFYNGVFPPTHKQANETVIIIRDGNPEEHCNKDHSADRWFIMISIAMGVATLIICACAIAWKIRKMNSLHYSTSEVQHVHHRS
ncbi:uncharacterized protein LOC113581981 isoform X1 [Electrophorus electricus]|uniref:uncharacterized protein LOC113581981 isoform X1 n=2 Tax=Electrophorus electricus TaxID=8005 RepID=UPI000F09E903|nr:uncharacterized protein LOC113581981 isoform X1 [Electrophorus electricus]